MEPYENEASCPLLYQCYMLCADMTFAEIALYAGELCKESGLLLYSTVFSLQIWTWVSDFCDKVNHSVPSSRTAQNFNTQL